ncbi:MAG: twitching motility protein PilT, partial [Bacteroidetes bacterium]|nr:twitching motility protein PilT [Bacteroidota bacterium]
YNEYMYCSSCQQYYWKGSHYKRMEEFIEEFLRPCSIKR